MAPRTPKTPKPAQNTSAPAPAEVKADVSTPAAAPAAAEVAPPAATEAKPTVATVEEAPLTGGGGEKEAVVTHTVSALPEKGFRRAGRFWGRADIGVNRADFDDDQWAALKNEPNLVVRELVR